MLRHNSIDLEKVYRERVKPELTHKESKAMDKALEAKPLRVLITCCANEARWYLLDVPPSLLGKHFGVAQNREAAEKVVTGLLGSTLTTGMVFI